METMRRFDALGIGAVYALAGGRWHLVQTGMVTWPRRDGARQIGDAWIDRYVLVDGRGDVTDEQTVTEEDRR